MTARALTQEQLDEMASLREEGWSARRIANRFTARGTQVSASCIEWQCLRIGADLPPERRQPSKQRTAPMRRGNFIVRPFTPEEDAELVRLDMAGASVPAICRHLDRKSNSVRGRLMTLARREARGEA